MFVFLVLSVSRLKGGNCATGIAKELFEYGNDFIILDSGRFVVVQSRSTLFVRR